MAKVKLYNQDNFIYDTADIDLWIKFASYFKQDEILFLENLKDKDISEFSLNEFNIYHRLKTQKEMSELLIKYENKKCTKDEYDRVSDFMGKNKLENFIDSRMTEEEIKNANDYVNTLTKDSLEKYIKLYKDKFNELSVYSAYVLLQAKKRFSDIHYMEFIERTTEEQSRRANHLRKSLLRDFGPCGGSKD